jgi:hypothetical protein
MIAAQQRHLPLVDLFLIQGADPNLATNHLFEDQENLWPGLASAVERWMSLQCKSAQVEGCVVLWSCVSEEGLGVRTSTRSNASG